MGFQLLGLDLRPITKLKMWTRKCTKCFQWDFCEPVRTRVCKDDSRVFCPFCGNQSLKRVQAFFTSDGLVGIGDFPFLLDKANVKKNRHRRKNSSSSRVCCTNHAHNGTMIH